jgi:DNA-binding MarR family transcriptional regulator
MEQSIFNVTTQNNQVEFRIVAALERLSEAFRVLLWNEAKVLNISPIQIQILIFLKFHSLEKCKVSYLAQEFNMTKATISDAVKVLLQKGLIEKETDTEDTRSYTMRLTHEGETTISQAALFANPLLKSFDTLSNEQKEILLDSLLQMIFRLHKAGIITIQRMCQTCQYLENTDLSRGNREGGYYCNLLKKPLLKSEFRMDCPEHVAV